jgi:hypothetical protein
MFQLVRQPNPHHHHHHHHLLAQKLTCKRRAEISFQRGPTIKGRIKIRRKITTLFGYLVHKATSDIIISLVH